MVILEKIILLCLLKLNGERTIYSIYHLLKGKKSSQTIQDIHLFSLTKYFGLYSALTREFLDDFIDSALKKGWITPCPNQQHHFFVTASGNLVIEHHLQQKPIPKFVDGWKYQQRTLLVWTRLSLLVQVVSNLVYQNSGYIPIQKNKEVHHWLKQSLEKYRVPRTMLGEKLFSELVACLEGEKDINPSVLVYRLTGHDRIGLTSSQAAQEMIMHVDEYELDFLNVLHYMIQAVENNPDRFEILTSLLSGTNHSYTLTNSTQRTFELLKKAYTIDEIAAMRNLKTSTVEDHIVEIALNVTDFSIDDFVNPEIQDSILKTARVLPTRQLKLIRENVNIASYFEIRLVMAKIGER
ncbi:MAG: helix-turn-helix domain-containing protein [Bacillota bacterium]|nr:helix-turn-helix domain-containing protein [Bacillota bacterium]